MTDNIKHNLAAFHAAMDYTANPRRKPVSYKPELIADDSGKWASNALRFATLEEATEWVADRAMRWTSVRATRVVESDDPVNYRWDGQKAVPLKPGDVS